MSFKLLQHRRQVGAFLEQQLPVQLENVLQVAGHPLRCPFWQWRRSRIAPDNLWWKAE
ncbi:hypothetical protein V5G92_23760 [Salmonella enterica subsp. enterica serovar Heidelberg]|uniref:hypothetical protein n=1 Tax=Salmonella enterica TaxID=28901 RepID=UPI00398A80F3